MIMYLLSRDSLDIGLPIGVTTAGDTLNILDGLRSWAYPLGSTQHKFKKRMIVIFKKLGFDYDLAPIPLWIKRRHPQSYLDQY